MTAPGRVLADAALTILDRERLRRLELRHEAPGATDWTLFNRAYEGGEFTDYAEPTVNYYAENTVTYAWGWEAFGADGGAWPKVGLLGNLVVFDGGLNYTPAHSLEEAVSSPAPPKRPDLGWMLRDPLPERYRPAFTRQAVIHNVAESLTPVQPWQIYIFPTGHMKVAHPHTQFGSSFQEIPEHQADPPDVSFDLGSIVYTIDIPPDPS